MKKIMFFVILFFLVIAGFVLGGCSNGASAGGNAKVDISNISVADLVAKVQDTATNMPGITLEYVITEAEETVSSGKIWGQPSNR